MPLTDDRGYIDGAARMRGHGKGKEQEQRSQQWHHPAAAYSPVTEAEIMELERRHQKEGATTLTFSPSMNRRTGTTGAEPQTNMPHPRFQR